MAFFDFVKTILETREMHTMTDCRTRYYKTNYNKAKEAILNYANGQNLDVQSVDDAHGEIYIQAKNFHIIAVAIQVTPIETAVDIKVQYYSLVGFNRPKKRIVEMYAFLKENLPLKGISLHP